MKEEGIEVKPTWITGSYYLLIPANIRDYLKLDGKSVLWLTMKDGGLFYEIVKR